MKVRAVGNRLSFPICTSTQRKSKCISEMVSVCLKLDNKWADLHACGGDRTQRRVCRRNTSEKQQSDSAGPTGINGKRKESCN